MIQAALEMLSDSSGLGLKELRYFIVLLSGFPLSYILLQFPFKTKYRHWMVISVSLVLGYIGNGLHIVNPIISALALYGILCTSIRESKNIAFVALGLIFFHLSLMHLFRQFIGYGEYMDTTGCQMMLAIKLASFAWNIKDGMEYEKVKDEPFSKGALKEMPSLLEFMSWVMFFPSFFVGPAFEYIEYKKWFTGKNLSQHKDYKKRCIKHGSVCFVSGFIILVIYLVGTAKFPMEFLVTDEFVKYGFWKRSVILFISTMISRFSYYFAWKWAEGLCAFAGMGFNEDNGKGHFDLVCNANMKEVELCESSRMMTTNWNRCTNRFLRNHVYLRCSKKWRTFITFLFSAVWHGFRFGYYTTFIGGAAMTGVSRGLRRCFRPIFVGKDNHEPIWYRVAGAVLAVTGLNYLFVGFKLLSFENVWHVSSSTA
eukprot:TRINITY_DN165661_c0_g2_i1.p1 TRINITY_DN165661_c0_g2~~TRINITY_DN165661_c0_g2_i1.p1  ORF type:complete len:426 (-),score=71.29 TRINITY_DN165661_c0_g2_i1:157-1434(-)